MGKEIRARLRELENKLTAMETLFDDSGDEKKSVPPLEERLKGVASRIYYINGLEYLGRPVRIKDREGPEAKRFVNLKKTADMPSRYEAIAAAMENPRARKVWVMELQGNKWRKVMDTIDL